MALSEWPVPQPLVGVKSRKRAIFEIKTGEVTVGTGGDKVSQITGVQLALESRIAAVGEEGLAVAQLVLGARELVKGEATQHDNLTMAHLGPHLAGGQGASAEEYAAAVAAAMQTKPQVVVLSQALSEGDEAWSRTFTDCVCDDGPVRAFAGAVVICVDQMTFAVSEACSKQWVGDNGLLRQEDISASCQKPSEDDSAECASVSTSDTCCSPPVLVAPDKENVSFIRNVSPHGPQADPLVAELVRQAHEVSQGEFHEDCMSPESTMKLTLLVSKCYSTLCGFIVSKVTNGRLSINKVAVRHEFRGCGFGKLIVEDTIASLKKHGEIFDVGLSSLPTAIAFYQRLGFKPLAGFRMKADFGGIEGQVYMVRKLKPGRKWTLATLPAGMEKC
eukprot:gnl/TRDRNA2_/TRDRNA2_189988_c0_seq1.p1 gnl/TRDRNA2_/TRDRNA2_189988_c0~~gnl/TRDRNA2_/TRDRNA2_189988_c0_seq1.p1  ORF type:complete len:389 (+),score=49.92 gnl/TRDRNA2_/TRDRNA2_189988_c0_seq1:172-1338(+)